MNIDISHFKRDGSFYGRLPLLLTIKSFDLQAIRKRYLASRKNTSGLTGSVERRQAGIGGVISMALQDGKSTGESLLCSIKEPRGIALHEENILAIAAEDVVYIIGDAVKKIEHDWFSYIHTVDISAAGNFLISSSGLETVLEFDGKTLDQIWEWNAWDHGINIANNPADDTPVFLTRNPAEAKERRQNGDQVKLIIDPLNEHLPTAMRSAFINSAAYDNLNDDNVIVTMFHAGAVQTISKQSGKNTLQMDNLKNPHGGRRIGHGLMATSTGKGEVVVKNELAETRYGWHNLPGKPKELKDVEWVQNTVNHKGLFIAIDSNRTAFVIFDPEKRLFDIIPYNDNWAVQDMVVGTISDRQQKTIKSLEKS